MSSVDNFTDNKENVNILSENEFNQKIIDFFNEENFRTFLSENEISYKNMFRYINRNLMNSHSNDNMLLNRKIKEDFHESDKSKETLQVKPKEEDLENKNIREKQREDGKQGEDGREKEREGERKRKGEAKKSRYAMLK